MRRCSRSSVEKLFTVLAALAVLYPCSVLSAVPQPRPAFTLLDGAEVRELTDRYRAFAQAAGEAGGAAAEGEYGNVTEEEAGKAQAPEVHVADPLEKCNRFWFKVNDRLYFYVLNPVAKGYKRAVSEGFRVLFYNFYRNVASPIRIINSLLQLKLRYAGDEFLRLLVNSTIGVGGLRDCAGECFGIPRHDRDFGQTLAFYHVGQGFYLVWPVLGPSTARDTVGLAGDFAADPITWFVPLYPSFGLRAHDRINYLSFHLGEYEALKRAAIDPYVALRSAYVQNRQASMGK